MKCIDSIKHKMPWNQPQLKMDSEEILIWSAVRIMLPAGISQKNKNEKKGTLKKKNLYLIHNDLEIQQMSWTLFFFRVMLYEGINHWRSETNNFYPEISTLGIATAA